MKLRSNKITKGIAFAGCSFTWGQGLHYYSNLPSLVELPLNIYDSNFLEFSHREFICVNRFARRVANYFNTFELVKYENGGSLDAIIDYWKGLAFDPTTARSLAREQNPNFRGYNPSDIGYFILQCTSWTRTNISINEDNINIPCQQLWKLLEDNKDELLLVLQKRNSSLNDFLVQQKKLDVERYKDLLIYLENLGIKTLIMTWPEDLAAFILSDPWLAPKIIKFNYLGIEYNSIETLIDYNSGLTINTDYQTFEVPPTDNHPSLLCHKIIAENIINSIAKEKYDRTTTNTL